MRYALIDGIRQEATKGAKGQCLCCGADVIAKCGKIRCWHWAHKNNEECPYSKKEPKSQWHQDWQNYFPEKWQEVKCTDEQTGEIHIADIKTPNGLVVEFQHSAINSEERSSREQFHKNMTWVVDGTRIKKTQKLGLGLANILCKILQSASWGLHDVIDGCETIHGQDNKKIKLFACPKAEQFFPKEWLDIPVPVFFDFNISEKTQRLNKKIILGLIYLDSKYYVVKLDYNILIEEIKSQKLIFDLVKAFPATVQNTVSPTPKQIYRKVNFLPSKSAQQINRIKSKNPGFRF